MKYERLTERVGSSFSIDNMLIGKAIIRLAELEDKIEQGTLMEINKPFIKKTKDGLYLICKAAVMVVEDFDTKSEAEAKLKELKGE